MVTFIHTGTCICGTERHAIFVRAVQISQKSMRTRGAGLGAIHPCPNNHAHPDPQTWNTIALDEESARRTSTRTGHVKAGLPKTSQPHNR